jgi:hypothetical protein
LFAEQLVKILREKKVSEDLIEKVIDSGYIIRIFGGFGMKPTEFVSDQMYGNKGLSSKFDIEKFIEYIHGEFEFPKLPAFNEYTVKSYKEIEDILSDPRRQHYIKEGRMSFRGQTSQYTYKRQIPNPVRADKDGREISIFSGVYRQNNEFYSFNIENEEERTLKFLLHKLEPNNPNVHLDSHSAHDIMRVEQHYATQTAGLDISFDIETAIFFATQKFQFDSEGLAYHTKIPKGDHKGVIYGFVFTDPPVKKTEFLIQNFNLFKTYTPERVLRQNCGLPLFGDYERNIATTDLDFIIYLDKDFDYEGKRTPKFMFPNTAEDKFYKKLLELKDEYPKQLKNIVEYKGSRVLPL